jgi:branched-chain amino acid transport system permease protein
MVVEQKSSSAGISRWLKPVAWLVVAALVLTVPMIANSYVQFIVNLAVVYVLVCLGFNLVIGYLGQLAFANAAFFGVGAYATSIAMAKLNLPFPVGLCLSALVGGVCGVLTGLPALRGIRKFYLAIITMAAGELLRWGYIHADWLTNGSTGLEVPAVTIAGFRIQSEAEKFYLFVAVVAPIVWTVNNLVRSRIGRAIVAIRESEQAAAGLAIPTSSYFVLTFGLSGMLVGVAGSLFAVSIGRVVPESFNLVQLIQQFAMVMLGGIGSVSGSIIGAMVVVAVPELTRGAPGMEELLFSIVLIVVILAMPGGLAGIGSRFLGIGNAGLFKGARRDHLVKTL